MKRGISVLAAIAFLGSAATAFAGPLADGAAGAAAEVAPAPETFGLDEYDNGADPALIPSPLQDLDPQSAIFTVEEATAPFLGPTTGAGSRVRIAVESPDYQDLFTVYFPRGSAYLTLPAGDMVAMAAEAVRGVEGVEIWISADAALTPDLAAGRLSVVEEILLRNDVPLSSIRVDDGSVDAILNRPASFSDDIGL